MIPFSISVVVPVAVSVFLLTVQCFEISDMNWNSEVPSWCNGTNKPYLLLMDEACLHITSTFTGEELADIWTSSSECYMCLLSKVVQLRPNESVHIVVNTTYPTVFQIQQGQNLCNFIYHFGEFGVYSLNISQTNCSDIIIHSAPANIYLPLLWVSLAIIAVLIVWSLLCIFREWNIFHNFITWIRINDAEDAAPLVSPDSNISRINVATRHRIRSLDTFRGLTIALMILVNYGGGGYWFLRHAAWNGLTVADVVFPWFVWIMGTSSVLSVHSLLRRAVNKRRICLKILRRSSILIILGLILNSNGGTNLYTYRIPGVLQRLGVVYWVITILELLCMDPEDNQRYSWYAPVRDIFCSWRQWVFIILVQGLHLSLTFLLDVPGCPVGYLGPGGLHDGGLYANCTGGAARFIDTMLLGENHIYQRPTAKAVYKTHLSYDPEGILGSLTCLLCGYLGAEAGKILLIFPSNKERIMRWMSWSVVMAAIGVGLCGFSIEDGVIPINKNLWSLSYVLITSSLAFAMLVVLYMLIDVLSWWSGAPFRYSGMNALLLYVGHVISKLLFPFSWSPVGSTHAAHFGMNMTGTTIWILISWILYKKKFFVTL